MKKFFAVSLFAFAAVAQASVFPHVWNNGRTVTLDAWNHSDRQVRCSGPIYLELSDNRRDTIHVFEYLWPRQSLYRTYYPNTVGATIERVSHSVWCW